MMVLFLNFFVCVFPVIAIMLDPVGPGIMDRAPRDPDVGITNGPAVRRWIINGAILCIASAIPLVLGPDTPAADHPTASMTMAFVVMGLGSVLSGLVLRREPESGLAAPLLTAIKVLSVPVILVVLATELDFLQRWLTTQPLTGSQWLACLGLALLLPVVAEVDKVLMRRRATQPVLAPPEAVSPARARV
nr:cation-translocating P-type ATPase C-terminal domain-containing protein [Cellulomonas humilata]